MEQLADLYEVKYNQINDRLYKASRWPTAEAIGPLVGGDENFVVLYKELYYRHANARLKEPGTVEDRMDSYENYIEFFNMILGLETEAPELELPAQWMWDIIDEFLDQFQSFHQYRCCVSAHTEDEQLELKEAPHAWAAQTVILYLQYFMAKAGIRDVEGAGDDPVEGTVAPMFQRLGEFSLIGLVRVMTIMGDYYGALELLGALDLNDQAAKDDRVLTAHTSLYYYVGFSYLMLRRYADARDAVVDCILYYGREKFGMSPHFKLQEEGILLKIEQMYGVLALALVFSPHEELDESIKTGLFDTSKGDLYLRYVERGDVGALDQLFAECAPKFVTPSVPDYDAKDDTHLATYNLQLRILQTEVRQRDRLQDVYSYLKMCTSITTAKLAGFLAVDEDTLATYLMNTKHKRRNKTVAESKPVSDGVWRSEAIVEFSVVKDMVQVAEHNTTRRYGQYFIGQINKFENLLDDIQQSA